jgi:predicted dehydrogenase
MQIIRFGIIGGGLMAKEFASAAARWCHLLNPPARPEIVALCSARESSLAWFKDNIATIRQATTDYRQLLANQDVQAVYIAVPHHLHREMYCAAIEAGKHLLGEKPFGIDKPANDAILAAAKNHADVLVRCSSEFPFYPAVQRICDMIESSAFGRIIEVNAGFLHSSDLDPNKPINWKRQTQFCGQYGCMGDLGMHVLHVPLRAGWMPQNVGAILGKIIAQRPDGKGGQAVCDTWDNATLLCTSRDSGGAVFPMMLKTHRIAPGERNTWYLEILGTRSSARWSSRNPRLLELLDYKGGEQTWQQIQTGYEPAFKTITGPIFEFGFTDSILQMFAAFIYELAERKPLKKFAACVTPEETAISHRLFTAALQSRTGGAVVPVGPD